MLNIEDWSDLPLSDRNGTYGGMAGAKRGVIYNNEPWMIKLPKRIKRVDVSELSYTTSEYYGAVTPQIRQAGNRLSGLTETACTSLLA